MADPELLRSIFGDDSDDEENIQGHSAPPHQIRNNEQNVNDDEVLVETGMVYGTIDELFKAYQEHARRKGFSIVKRTLVKGDESQYRYALMVCDKAGISKANKASKKVDCKARLNAKKLGDGTWTVSKMVHDHNHEIDPVFSPLMAAHRHLSVHMKRQLEANDIAGIRTCKNVRLCEVQSGGPENIGCLPKDCRNFIEERRRLRLGEGDAEAIRKMFAKLQVRDNSFFHLMDIDDDNRLCNVLWFHPRSKAAYEEFHDVVSLDTTYLVNRYKMPFATIVGVNHHGHSILLGCALVSNERADTYKWVFSNWLEAMGGIHPTAIITDQAETIKIAIRELMPNTIHRYCIWHILSKVGEKFKRVRDIKSCTVEFKGLVYDSITIDIFERKWTEFLVKYRLENNEWLIGLYNEREKWVPVYLNHTFWAGMISTQRSEGMHAYFDDFVHSRSTLKQFMEQYDVAIGNKFQKEFMADFQSKNRVIKCVSQFPWEKQFQRAYTNSIFNRVQDEIKRMMYCHVVPPTEDEAAQDLNGVGIERIRVLERSIVNNFYVKEFTYTVEWRPNGEYINCNCKKFEFKGIFCPHIMKVLAQRDIQTVNERYLLPRWRKDVYRRHCHIFVGGGHMTDEYKKYQAIEKLFQQAADLAMGNTGKLEFIERSCNEMKNALLNWNPPTPDDESDGPSRRSQSPDIGGNPLLDPHVARTVGRPRTNRYMSASETRGRGGRARGGRARGRPPGRGRGRGEPATRGGRGRGAIIQQDNDEFLFDLNEDLNAA